MCFDPGLPVRVAHCRGTTREHQLPRNEVVVRDSVGGEVAEISQSEGSQSVSGREIVNLLAHVPIMAMAAERRVMLRDRGVCGDVAVQEVERVRTKQLGDAARQGCKVRENRFSQVDVGTRGPGVRFYW